MTWLTAASSSVQHVFVNTSAWTFSAGIVNVALRREHGGPRVTVVGTGVGDRVRLWAEGGSMVLPHSKLSLGFATGLHDYSRSCFGNSDCFWTMRLYPMHVTNLDPDVVVAYNFRDYVDLKDPSLERVMVLAASFNPLPAR